jgi:uracil-DNA glycosylase family 4
LSEADPRAELAELTIALQAELERETLRGRLRAPFCTGLTAPPASPQALAASCQNLSELRAVVADCRACKLCNTRQQTVFADGTGSARVMFIGEAPGANEDAQGIPFVGDAGKLLTDIITKGMKLRREDVYITNVLKCRPPENRDPEHAEKELCTHFLDRQIELVNPEVLIPLGEHASAHILSSQLSMDQMRGKVHVVNGRKVVPTYHPAHLLRDKSKKRDCWQDIQLALEILGEVR